MKYLIALLFPFVLFSCSSEVNDEDVFSEFKISKQSISADGQSTAEAKVVLNPDADSDRRNVIFKISNGAFLPPSTDPTTITVKAAYENGVLIAKASFRSTTTPGLITITAQPEFDSPISEFIQTISIESTFSKAASLTLAPSAYGIMSNHLNEVQLIGTLLNADKKQVSNGHKVLFSDKLADGKEAKGQFRALVTTSDSASKVSVFYSASIYPVGTQINIICSLLDSNGNPSSIKDEVILTINQ